MQQALQTTFFFLFVFFGLWLCVWLCYNGRAVVAQ